MISLVLTIIIIGCLLNRYAMERTSMIKATINQKRHFRKG